MISIKQVYELYKTSTGVQTDTRKLASGQLYFALQGPNFDGNQFAKQALDLGACAVIVSDPELAARPGHFYTPNTLACLQRLAHHHRQSIAYPIIGITGSNGKTTTKELVRAILIQNHRVSSTRGNLNNHIGVPLTLLALDQHQDLAIIEMGANQPGDIKQLCQIAEPTHGLITNIGFAHLEGFGSLDMTRLTKGALMYHVLYHQNRGCFFLNRDEASLLEYEFDHPRIKSISHQDLGAGVKLEVLQTSPNIAFRLQRGDQSLEISSQLYGKHNVNNLMVAVSVGVHFDVTLEMIAAGIEGYSPDDNRSQLRSLENVSVYLDAYNANPTSVSASIAFFAALDVPKKWLILGDMFELGDEGTALHRSTAIKADQVQFDRVYLVGSNFGEIKVGMKLSNRVHFVASTEKLIEELEQVDWAGETLYVKGSRGMRLESIMSYLPPRIE